MDEYETMPEKEYDLSDHRSSYINMLNKVE